MKRIIMVALAVSVAAACASKTLVKSKFSPEQASFVNVKGEYSVAGQAFLTTRDGHVVYAAGSPVALTPKTDYADEVYNIVFSGGNFQPSPPDIDNLDPRFKEIRRNTVANGEGRFQFKGLPPGEYYLLVPVTWEISNGYGARQVGGLLLRRVSLPLDDGSEIVMTR